MEMKTAKANCLPSSTPPSFPSLIVGESWSTYFTDLWSAARDALVTHQRHYNLPDSLADIMLDGPTSFVEQTTRNRHLVFFNFNGTAGIGVRKAIAMSGGWQHDTLTEGPRSQFRAQ